MANPTHQFFISRAGEDKDVALAIDQMLRDAGYTTFIQDRDFGHTAFTERMDEGFRMVEDGAQIIALFSRAYQTKPHCLVEARYPLTDDPSNTRQRLIVLRIEECAPVGFLKPIPYVDLVPLFADVAALRKAVLGAVAPEEHRKAADFAALYRRSGKQILHPEIRAVPGFTARGDELKALDGALWGKSGRAAITDSTANTAGAAAAVRGMGGVGKSVLAQQYAWVNRERYQGVWWVRAETHEALHDDLIELGSRFLDKIEEIPDRAAAAQLALDHIAQTPWEKPWLLIYDNVESPDQIEKLAPTNGAHMLLTTRWSDWHGHAQEVPVDVFPKNVAVAYLMERARGGEDRPNETHSAAEQLADDLGHLPLALAIARAHAWGMNWTLAQYRNYLAEMLEREPNKLVDYPRSITATFTLALEKAKATSPEAEQLLNIAAFLAPDRIPVDIFTEDVMSEIEKGEAVAALAEVSLITRETLDDGSAGISVHRLVQQVMRGRLGAAEQEMAALATKLVADAYPAGDISADDVRSWPACRRLESHAIVALSTAPESGDHACHTAQLLSQYALHLKSRAEFAAAEPLYRRALSIVQASLEPDHPSIVANLNNLAMLLQDINRMSEAEPLYRRAIELLVKAEQRSGDRDPNYAVVLSNFAQLLALTNRPNEAERLYRSALAIDEASIGPDHAKVGAHLSNLALLLQQTKRLVEAEPLMRRALAICEACYGPNHPTTAIRLNNLAGLLEDTKRFDEAETLLRRALAIDEASLGASHPDVAIDLNNLAQLLKGTKRPAGAEPLFIRALAIFEKSLGADHPSTKKVRSNLDTLLAQIANTGGDEGSTSPADE